MGKTAGTIVAVLLGGWVLGLVHGMLSVWLTPIVIKLLMLAGIGAVMVGVLKGVRDHVLEDTARERWGILPLLGVGLGVFTLWGSWCGWVWAASDFRYFMALHPLTLYDVVRGVTENAEYSASSNGSSVPISRASVKAAWLLEAAAIAGGGLLAGVFAAFGEEEKSKWEF